MSFSPPTLLPSLDALAPTDIVVVGVSKTKEGPLLLGTAFPAEVHQALTEALAQIEADGAKDSTWRVPPPSGLMATSVVFVGLGEAPSDTESLRAAAGYAAQSVTSPTRLVFTLPHADEAQAQAIVEGALLGSYRTAKIPQRKRHLAESGLSGVLFPRLPWAAWLPRVKPSSWCGTWVTGTTQPFEPCVVVADIEKRAEGSALTIEVLDEKRLEAEGYGGLTAVGKGSINPPRLMILTYTPANPTRHVALVGKGITFDSGGLSLKPPTAMVGMKYDMTGAAVMAAATLAAAEMGAPAAITTYLCLAENMPSGTASRPNDVITIKGGKTVEVLNTDAEGRLVMADGLQAASALSPDLIIDAATLTGAARIALGERYAGLMGTDEAVAAVQEAATNTGELVWHMPLPGELRTILNSDVADIANVKPGEVLGGMLSAGQFLKEFVGTTKSGDLIPWAHLDIAGPAANSSGPYGYTPKGPTGAITRTLISLLMS